MQPAGEVAREGSVCNRQLGGGGEAGPREGGERVEVDVVDCTVKCVAEKLDEEMVSGERYTASYLLEMAVERRTRTRAISARR